MRVKQGTGPDRAYFMDLIRLIRMLITPIDHTPDLLAGLSLYCEYTQSIAYMKRTDLNRVSVNVSG